MPQVLRAALYGMLLVAGLLSVTRLGEYGPLPTTTLLDVWIILFIATSVIRSKVVTTGLLLFLGVYLLTRVIPAMASLSPLEDFLQAYRWILYLAAFAFAVGRTWGPIEPLKKVAFALIGMALVKAGLTYILRGSGERPGLLLENNFELALFCGLIAVLYGYMNTPERFASITMIAALTLLAGSRSGAFAFLLLAIFALSQARISRGVRAFLVVYLVPILTLVPIWILAERSQGGTQTIDRINFLQVFLSETQKWGLLEWLFGTVPITPLSDESCARLSYFKLLFSSVDGETCYSVIFHAFLLRVVFDAGIVGLVIAFGVTILCLRKAGVTTALTICLVGIAGTNSLSVSGLNNPYVALPLLIAIATTTVATKLPSSFDRPAAVVGDTRRFLLGRP